MILYYSDRIKFHGILPKTYCWARDRFFEDSSNRRSTGTNAYWHWVISTSIFRKSWKSMKNPDLANKEATRGTRFWDLFGDIFWNNFTSDCWAGKSSFRNANSILIENCAEGAILSQLQSTSLAVLDAVLEDKPAQPLPCGSYLVAKFPYLRKWQSWEQSSWKNAHGIKSVPNCRPRRFASEGGRASRHPLTVPHSVPATV